MQKNKGSKIRKRIMAALSHRPQIPTTVLHNQIKTKYPIALDSFIDILIGMEKDKLIGIRIRENIQVIMLTARGYLELPGNCGGCND